MNFVVVKDFQNQIVNAVQYLNSTSFKSNEEKLVNERVVIILF